MATSGAGYALVGVDVDIVRFERLVAEGRAHLGEGDAPAAAQSLRRALALLRGEPLAEFASSEFAVGERTRLEELGCRPSRPVSRPTWPWAATPTWSASWRPCAGSIRCGNRCGRCA